MNQNHPNKEYLAESKFGKPPSYSENEGTSSTHTETKTVLTRQPTRTPPNDVDNTKETNVGPKFKPASDPSAKVNIKIPDNQMALDFFSFLDSVPSLLISEKINIVESVTTVASQRKYAIIDPEGHCRLIASEISGCCDRFWCGLNRSFRLQIRDMAGNLCIEIERNIDCSCLCGLFMPDSIKIKLVNDSILGTVKQRRSLAPSYSIKGSDKQTKYVLKGELCPIHCPGHDVEFKLLVKDSRHGSELKRDGMIIKYWVGLAKECCTDADDFHLQFPTKANANDKALCLAAVFLINMRHFESSAKLPKVLLGMIGL